MEKQLFQDIALGVDYATLALKVTIHTNNEFVTTINHNDTEIRLDNVFLKFKSDAHLNIRNGEFVVSDNSDAYVGINEYSKREEIVKLTNVFNKLLSIGASIVFNELDNRNKDYEKGFHAGRKSAFKELEKRLFHSKY